MANPETLTSLKRTFKDLLGFRAPAPVGEAQATSAAKALVELESKVVSHQTQPSDLLRAAIVASQRLQWFEQENYAVASGDKPQVGSPEMVTQIQEKLSGDNLPPTEIMRLMGLWYHYDPTLGATRAMDLLLLLHQFYPNIPLKEGDELDLGALR